jgi:hypothetical protein
MLDVQLPELFTVMVMACDGAAAKTQAEETAAASTRRARRNMDMGLPRIASADAAMAQRKHHA